jgi:hypothetical protein
MPEKNHYSTGPLIGPPNHRGSSVMGPRNPSHQVNATLWSLDEMPQFFYSGKKKISITILMPSG